MKKILTILFVMFSMAIFAQTTSYSYKIKLFGVTDSVSASGISDIMKDIFQTNHLYNNTTSCFEFNSKMSINGTGFGYSVGDEGYIVSLFEKKEITYTEENPQIIYVEEGDH